MDQLGQVRAGGRGGHPGLGRQGGGSQSGAVTKRQDHPGPARVSQHSGHRSNIGISRNMSHTANPTRPKLRLPTKLSRTAQARVPSRKERTGAAGASRARASSSSPTWGPVSR
jgi:hypothetical protein